jgi:membrane protein DedA with SNARE-associated domain
LAGSWQVLERRRVQRGLCGARRGHAGGLRYPLWKFFIFCWAGKTIKSLAFAFAGYGLFDGITREIEGMLNFGSTAQIAQILKANVILVLDVNGMRINAATNCKQA